MQNATLLCGYSENANPHTRSSVAQMIFRIKKNLL